MQKWIRWCKEMHHIANGHSQAFCAFIIMIVFNDYQSCDGASGFVKYDPCKLTQKR